MVANSKANELRIQWSTRKYNGRVLESFWKIYSINKPEKITKFNQ